MNIPTYKLFRTRNPGMIKPHSHSIAIECMIKGEKWSSNVASIEPWQLKAVVSMMKDSMINTANHHYGEIVVTSIG